MYLHLKISYEAMFSASVVDILVVDEAYIGVSQRPDRGKLILCQLVVFSYFNGLGRFNV